jgi:hypothetical protein
VNSQLVISIQENQYTITTMLQKYVMALIFFFFEKDTNKYQTRFSSIFFLSQVADKKSPQAANWLSEVMSHLWTLHTYRRLNSE